MARESGSGYCGFRKGFLVRGGSRSDRAPLANSPGGLRTGTPREVVEISSDEEEDEDGSAPRSCDLVVEKKINSRVRKEDDDCVVLESDPDGTIAVGEEMGSVRFDGSLDELQIVAEKGQVACRDFPHARHLCSRYPFITTSHVNHCNMCYCFACDAPAPCNYWGQGLSTDDHCHGTDKEMRWKILRDEFMCGRQPAPHSEKHENVVYPAMAPHRHQDVHRQVSAPQSDPSFLSGFSHFSVANGNPFLNAAHQNQERHSSGSSTQCRANCPTTR